MSGFCTAKVPDIFLGKWQNFMLNACGKVTLPLAKNGSIFAYSIQYV